MQKFVSEIQNRLQFCSTVAIFFAAVLNNFYNVYAKDSSDKTVLQYSIIILFYLLSYIFFDLIKNVLKSFVLKFINVLIFIGLFSFIPLLIIFISGNNLVIHGLKIYALEFSIGLMMFLPVILFSTILGGGFYYLFDKYIKIQKNKK
jgi:hypothetical protein